MAGRLRSRTTGAAADGGHGSLCREWSFPPCEWGPRRLAGDRVQVGGAGRDRRDERVPDRPHRRGGAIAFAAGIAVPVALVPLLFCERWAVCAPASASLAARWLARLRRAGV